MVGNDFTSRGNKMENESESVVPWKRATRNNRRRARERKRESERNGDRERGGKRERLKISLETVR